MNTTLLLVVFIAGFLVNGIFLYLFLQNQKKQSGQGDSSVQMLNQNMQGLTQRIDVVASGMNQRLDRAAEVISQVTRELGSMQEIGRNMQGLQEFLRSPKLRGNIGEKVLEQMLEQCFPKALFHFQYQFKNGQMVDAIIKTEKGWIPIDAKFPLENYQRLSNAETDDDRAFYTNEFIKDVKRHVNSIAKKYILPDEGTVDFALMYIPSESVYYEILKHDVALQMHGMEKQVLFVSPNSLYYYLQIILAGLKEKKVADAAREIIKAIKGIQIDSRRFTEQLSVLERHVTNSQGALVKTKAEFDKLAGKIERIDDITEHSLPESI